ncbi:MAG: PEP-CTERM sorting domain-containing protein [Phycisphaerales bacterium JB059]
MKSLITAAALAALAGGASADVLSSVAPIYDTKTETTAGDFTAQTSRAGFTRTVALDQVAVWDGLGSANNVVMTIDMAALFGLASGSAIDLNGIGWDVTVSTFGASWLSEATMYFDNQTQDSGAGIFLSVGAGNDFAGTANFTSGGIVKLVDAGLPDLVLADGMLRIEFWDSFDDITDEIDAIMDGSITLQSSVPAPSGVALLGLGGLVAARRRR